MSLFLFKYAFLHVGFVFEAHASPAWPSRSVTKYRTFEVAKFGLKMPILTNCNKILTKNVINSGLSGSDAANGPNTDLHTYYLFKFIILLLAYTC